MGASEWHRGRHGNTGMDSERSELVIVVELELADSDNHGSNVSEERADVGDGQNKLVLDGKTVCVLRAR